MSFHRQALLTLPLLLTLGCGLRPSVTPAVSATLVQGAFHGGQQPVSGAQIQLYTVGTTADGSASTPLLPTPAVTGADGSFNFTTHTPCPSQSSLVYLAATGGNPGLSGSVNNSAIVALAVIGTCTDLANSTYLNINEVTTVAAVNALAPFLTSASAIGSSPSDAPALAGAFTLATQYANLATGASPGTNVPSGYFVPSALIYTLADSIAPCINSTGTDGTCATLFAYTTPSGSSTPPADTVAALLNIANNPTSNVGSLYALSSANAPFQPILTAAPASLAVALSITPPAVLTVTPASLTFPSTSLTFAAPVQTLTIQNTGSVYAMISGISFTGTNPADFTQTNTCNYPIAVGDSCSITVTVTPSALGSRTASLTLAANTASPTSVPLSVTGVTNKGGSIAFSTTGLAWYTAGLWQDVTVTNTGSSPVTFKSVAITGSYAGEFSIKANACGLSLAAGANCTLSLNAPNADTNFHNATLTFVDDAVSGPTSVQLVDSSTTAVSLNPFPSTAVGSSSTATGVVSPYSRAYSVSFSGPISGPNVLDFSPSPVGCSGTLSSCYFSVTFTPQGPGQRVARIVSPNATGYLPLVGTAPAFAVPTSLAIQAGVDGSTGATVSGSAALAIVNTGTVALNLAPLTIATPTPSVFAVSQNCSGVAPGSTCTANVSFNAIASTGTYTATLSVTDNASGITQSVPITVTVADYAPVITPYDLTFPAQHMGVTSAPMSLTVGDPLGHPLGHPISIALVPDSFNYPGNASYVFPQGTTCPASTTQLCTFYVAFDPMFYGNASLGNLFVTDQTTGLRSYMYLYGTGTNPPAITFNPTSYAFPTVARGSSAVSTPIVLQNTGEAPLNISRVSFNNTDGANFTQTNDCPAGLAISATCSFIITFAPGSSTGSFVGNLTVDANTAAGASQVTLTGTGK